MAVLGLLAFGCGGSGGRPGIRSDGGDGPLADVGSGNFGGSGGSGGTGGGAAGGGASGSIVGRWWGVLPTTNGPSSRVIEVLASSSDMTHSVHVWSFGAPISGTLTATLKGWQVTEGTPVNGGQCWSLVPAASGASDSFDVSSCTPGVSGRGILRRSRSTRIYEGPVDPRGLGFDGAGTRFGFATGDHFWLWDATRARLGDLDAGTAVPYAQIGIPLNSIVFSSNGRHTAYLRGGPTPACRLANLMLFDGDTGQARALASGVPCSAGFARFSPAGDVVAAFSNDNADGGGADLSLWSVGGGSATVVASGINAGVRDSHVFFGASGRHLVYRITDPKFGSGWNMYEGLASYDLGTKQSTMLATSARDVTLSADGGMVAYSTAAGQVGLWKDQDGNTTVLDPGTTTPDTFYGSGLAMSPDGKWVAYLATNGVGRLYATTTGTTTTLGTGGISCHLETLPVLYGASFATRMRAAYFPPEFPGAIYWPTQMPSVAGCYAGEVTTTPFRFRDLGTSQETTGLALSTRLAFGPRGEVIGATEGSRPQFVIWTRTGGMKPVVDSTGTAVPTPSTIQPIFRADGSQMVFSAPSSTGGSGLWVWDAATETATQILSTLPSGPFRFLADRQSGQVVLTSGDTGPSGIAWVPLMLWGPGSAKPAMLLDQASAPVTSDSGAVLAARGVQGSEQAIFVFRFGTSAAVMIEDGTVLGISDRQLVFQAPDGVCVQSL